MHGGVKQSESTRSVPAFSLEIAATRKSEMAKLIEPILADTDTLRQRRVMTGNGSIVGAGTDGLSTNDINVATTGQQSLNVPETFQSSKSNGQKIKLATSDPMMIMSWGLSDRDYEAGDEQSHQKRIRSVSADRILESELPLEARESLSPDQRRVRSSSAGRILEGERSRQDSLSSLRTLESQSSERSWGGYTRPGVSRRGWRSSWLGSQSLSATEETARAAR